MFVSRGAREIGKSCMIMLPVPLHGEFKLVRTSLQEPFLCVGLNLNPQKISELLLKIYPHGLTSARQQNNYVADADFDIINALNRLLACFPNSGDTQCIAPLIMEEVLIRALRGPLGIHIMETGFADSNVVKVIAWIRENFARHMKVSDLADMIHMSEASFYNHFKIEVSASEIRLSAPEINPIPS
ncbi:MAG: AraC family transcriptional regulator N-terminal domain-containing protein [Treponema sp.]|nr:AraC family transcriptional regulator N-terminal domain-containing protein [Treponema sp.]